MPVYEYYCDFCEYVFEINKPMRDMDKEQLCLKCKAKVERLFPSSGAIIFKCKGFYKTDSRSQDVNK